MSENNNPKNSENSNDKWDFSDYAFTITGIIVGVLLVGPTLLEVLLDTLFGITISNGNAEYEALILAEGLEYGQGVINGLSITELRFLSPLLFLLTTTIVFFQEAIIARKSGGYKGSMFTHTFESLFEEAIYMAITTIMVYGAVFFGMMYISWLAGPISWVLFIIIFPLVRKKDSDTDNSARLPWLLLIIFAFGIIAEVLTGAWLAFPLSWLIICAAGFVTTIRERDHSIDSVFNALYYAFSVIYMAVGIGLDFWILSWSAFPIALFICWILSKSGKFKKAEADKSQADKSQ